MSVSDWSGSFLAWEEELHGLKQRIGRIFARYAVRESAGLFLDGPACPGPLEYHQ